jgi:NOL1/NOP2/fmu family ribosome biogenesis protein
MRGEGHFVAKLVKKAAGNEVGADIEAGTGVGAKSGARVGTITNAEAASRSTADRGTEAVESYDKLPESFHSFVKDNLNDIPEGVYLLRGHNLYLLPEAPPRLDGLKAAKFGWFLGSFEDRRFEPSHSMVTALEKEAIKRTVDLDASSREVWSYLKGETVMLEGEKGLTAVCVNGWTLGWAKQTGDMLKNLYPKGWRRLS